MSKCAEGTLSYRVAKRPLALIWRSRQAAATPVYDFSTNYSRIARRYFAEWNRFSTSAQFTTFHQAARYSLRRF